MSAPAGGQADGPPPLPEQSAPFDLGPAHHSLTVRGLTAEEYLGASRQLMARVRKNLNPSRSQALLALLVLVALGGLAGYLLAASAFNAVLVMTYGRPLQSAVLQGLPLMMAIALIFLAGFAAQIAMVLYFQKKLYRQAIARNRTFAMPQHLAFSDTGARASCQAGVTAVPWSRFSHRFRHAGLQFLVIDQAVLLWIPEADLAADAGLAQFLDRHMPVRVQ